MTILPALPSGALGLTTSSFGLWASFALIVPVVLALDLGLFQRTRRDPTTKEALVWCGVWLLVASLFALGISVALGSGKALEFVTAYFVEQGLSVDNLFVMMLIFVQLGVPRAAQRSALVWGILGAVVLRGVLIFTGTALIGRFHFLTYVFGAFLILAAAKLLREITRKSDSAKTTEEEPVPSRLRALIARVMPLTDTYEGSRFTVVRAGVRHATPLLLAVVTIELADAVFALDSIPAVFGVTTDPLIVFTSNLFAVLGLRSLFFALSGLLEKLVYLKHGLVVVLLVVGAKMLAAGVWTAPTWLVLTSIVLVLGTAVVASLIKKSERREGVSHALES